MPRWARAVVGNSEVASTAEPVEGCSSVDVLAGVETTDQFNEEVRHELVRSVG